MDIEIDSGDQPIDRVCRTCLCPTSDSFEALEELSFEEICEILNKTFGRIVNIDENYQFAASSFDFWWF